MLSDGLPIQASEACLLLCSVAWRDAEGLGTAMTMGGGTQIESSGRGVRLGGLYFTGIIPTTAGFVLNGQGWKTRSDTVRGEGEAATRQVARICSTCSCSTC